MTLRRRGYKAYFAGGCVRDMLMGKRPVDYDIATDALPGDVIGLFDIVIPVGREFGVVVVVVGGDKFEVTTFRREGAYLDGRRPSSIEFTDEEEDAHRRDFTINGIFYDPIDDRYLDYVGGREDIRRGIIRSIGDPEERFREDRLRILRGIRFSSRFRFPIEDETRAAITGIAPLVKSVSAERIRDEVIKILMGPYPHVGMSLMHELGVMEVILPEVSAMDGIEQPPAFHPEGDVLTHTLLMLEIMSDASRAGPGTEVTAREAPREDGTIREVPPESRLLGCRHSVVSIELALGVLLHDIGKPSTMERADRIRFNNHAAVGAGMSEQIMKRLRFSKVQNRRVVSLVRNHLKFIEVRKMRRSTLKRFLTMENFDQHLELHRLDCLASHGDLSNYEFCRERLLEIAEEPLPVSRLLTGRDLIRLGFTPGPLFKEILTHVEDLQLEGRIRTKEEAEKAIIALYGNK